MKLNAYKQSLYALGAPAVLLLVACFQIYLTQVYGLSQWKGGGFGMFSTVDSPGARFLRIYLETPNGRIPVEVPGEMKALAREIRTIPTPAGLCRLTSQLAQARWVPYDYAPFGKDLNSSALQDDSIPNDATGSSLALPQMSDEQPNEIVTTGDHPLLRTLGVEEPRPTDSVLIDKVSVELWQFKFDEQALRIDAAQYSECNTTIKKVQK